MKKTAKVNANVLQTLDDITKYKSKGHIIVDMHTNRYFVGLAGLYTIMSTVGSCDANATLGEYIFIS